MCGRLSRLVSTQRATSDQGETLLLPPGRRLRFQRVMWNILDSPDVKLFNAR